jgi:hypothetical protein
VCCHGLLLLLWQAHHQVPVTINVVHPVHDSSTIPNKYLTNIWEIVTAIHYNMVVQVVSGCAAIYDRRPWSMVSASQLLAVATPQPTKSAYPAHYNTQTKKPLVWNTTLFQGRFDTPCGLLVVDHNLIQTTATRITRMCTTHILLRYA